VIHRSRQRTENAVCLASKLISGGKRMLEWKPRLFALVAALGILAAFTGDLLFFLPGNFGWGLW